MSRPDSSTPHKGDVLSLPDSPGLWFYQATRMPTIVIRKEDGELYFQGGSEGQEEMKVEDFGRMKDQNPAFDNYGFVKLQPVIDGQFPPNQLN